MQDLYETLGVDPDDIKWEDLALCQGTDLSLYYEQYENDEDTARTVDEVCLSCPVLATCLRAGNERGEWGVWGAVYLVNGKMEPSRNKHKNKAVWKRIRERVGESDAV